MLRPDGRAFSELRPVVIRRGFTKHAEGSVLIEIGDTRVICNASVQEKIPEFLEGSGKGWITAEYSMLPRSTKTRTVRGSSGRAFEIQRLIGRALRSVVDLSALGPRTIQMDCDVIQADGGTRTAAITGSFVALHDALTWLIDSNGISSMPTEDYVAATSVGIIEGVPMLDLCHEEDSRAEVDLNVIMTKNGRIIEIQGTAEKTPFAREILDDLLDLAQSGVRQLVELQVAALSAGSPRS
ncbi:MAG: ribonuclease PH [Candidatus Hydrogenedentota bacterium]|nr:MAG: ribonuclease PH [Candidatus Hydrogenedentota bacterium]